MPPEEAGNMQRRLDDLVRETKDQTAKIDEQTDTLHTIDIALRGDYKNGGLISDVRELMRFKNTVNRLIFWAITACITSAITAVASAVVAIIKSR